MTMISKYRLKKRIKNFLIFYVIVCILFVASYTLSRYVETSQGVSGIEVAKFNVSVNDENIRDGKPVLFNFSETSKIASRKVAPNNNGYFAFTINPEGTEVSLEYEIKFMLDELDEDFKLEYFTVNDSETHYEITNGNLIKNDLLIPTTETGFVDDDKIDIKVYWSWNEKEDIINPDINDYENKNIEVIVIVKQKIN